MDLKNWSQSKKFIVAIAVVGGVAVVFVVFQAGVLVGYRKAGFSYRGGENYYQTFGRPNEVKMLPNMMRRELSNSNSNGVIGKIIEINLPNVVIETADKIETVMTIETGTTIRRFRDNLKATDLAVDNFVAVLGSADNQGKIKAKLIRLIPPPPKFKKQK